VTGSIRKE